MLGATESGSFLPASPPPHIVEIAVLVNLHSRRGSDAVAHRCRTELPQARVLTSRSLDDAARFARELVDKPAELVLSGGGDGTVIGLINGMRDAWRASRARSAIGILPLGTGNGWARATGAPAWREGIDRVARAAVRAIPFPLRRFDLVEACGTLAHFAGTGWDAEIIDDFHAQKSGFGLLPPPIRNGFGGYLHGLCTRTVPRKLKEWFARATVEVELYNTGDDALVVDEAGHPHALRGGEHGKLLYRGPVSVCAAGTSRDWGFGFHAFPFARLVPRRFCMRVYAAGALGGLLHAHSLWQGKHPLEHMHTWLLTRCRATFSRPVPFQVGGDRLGHQTVVDYALASEQVDLLDWHALRALENDALARPVDVRFWRPWVGPSRPLDPSSLESTL